MDRTPAVGCPNESYCLAESGVYPPSSRVDGGRAHGTLWAHRQSTSRPLETNQANTIGLIFYQEPKMECQSSTSKWSRRKGLFYVSRANGRGRSRPPNFKGPSGLARARVWWLSGNVFQPVDPDKVWSLSRTQTDPESWGNPSDGLGRVSIHHLLDTMI